MLLHRSLSCTWDIGFVLSCFSDSYDIDVAWVPNASPCPAIDWFSPVKARCRQPLLVRAGDHKDILSPGDDTLQPFPGTSGSSIPSPNLSWQKKKVFYFNLSFQINYRQVYCFLFTNLSVVCPPPREVFVAGVTAFTQRLISSPCVLSVSFHNVLDLWDIAAIIDCPPLRILTSGLVLDCWIIFPLWFVFPACFLEWVFLLEAKVNFALPYAGSIYVP